MVEPQLFSESTVGDVRLLVARSDAAPRLEPLLTEDEHASARGFKHPGVRARHIVSRHLRRRLLAACTGKCGEDLCFLEGEHGKPMLADAGGWDFNISHAGDFVVACAAPFPVGVDIEEVRTVPEMARIVPRYFHADEASAWEGRPFASREQDFFILWCAREAAMKCAGLGLAAGMEITRVDPVILDAREAGARVGAFGAKLHKLEAPPGYVMVVAAGL